MKWLSLMCFEIGISLINSLSYNTQTLVGNEAVRIVSSQQPWILQFSSLVYCSIISQQNTTIIAFDYDILAQRCCLYTNFTTFIYDATRTAYLKSSVNSFQLIPESTVIYNSSDKHVYMFGTTRSASSWQQAYDQCYATQGFSVMLAKRIYQFNLQVAQQLATGFIYGTGLRRNNVTGSIYWDDGVLYNTTEVSTVATPRLNGGSIFFNPPGADVYVFFLQNFDDDISWSFLLQRAACYANPFNVTLV